MNYSRFSSFGRLTILGTTLMMSGCASWLSGLDGKSEFTCGAPNGVSCMSISGVSGNVDRGNLPSSIREREKNELTRDINGSKDTEKPKKGSSGPAAPLPSYGAEPVLSPASMLTLGSGTPVRVPPKEIRIWMAPTEDTDGDLHEQRYIYVVVNDGRWMVDAVRLNTRNKYTRFQPLLSQSNVATEPEAKPSPQRDVRPVQTSPQPRGE